MPEAQILRFYELHIHIRFRAYYVLGMALFAVEIKINNFSGRNRSGNNQYQWSPDTGKTIPPENPIRKI